MPNKSQITKGTTVTESGSTGVETSKAQGVAGGYTPASYAELELALVESQRTNQMLMAKLNQMEAQQNSSSSSIDKLAEVITKAITQKPVEAYGPTESDNINRTNNFNTRATIDGRNLMEAQQTLAIFRGETKKPISIPKTMASKFGPSLSITVNGVRVSVPCDGKTYFINETHWEHARERMAKVDALDEGADQNIVEIG
jgi:hypothetical protein